MGESVTNLWGMAFDDEFKADEARALYRRMAGEGLLILEQTAVVVVGMDGKPKVTQDEDVTSERRTEGHWLGIAAAAMTGVVPLILVGTVAGEVVGHLTDHGITKQVMKPIIDALTPGTSALFGIGNVKDDADYEKIAGRIRHFNPTIRRSPVPPEVQQKIETLLAKSPETAAP